MDKKIYVCDDEEGIRRYLKKMLSGWGYRVEAYANPLLLLKALENPEAECDLLLLDIKMPELDGIETLRRVKTLSPKIPTIIMTGHGTIESAVEAIKLGAYDYLTKPFPQEKLRALIHNSLERKNLLEENTSLKKELREHKAPATPVFESPKFAETFELAKRVAASDSSILILGESGTGKELIAGTIHYESDRAQNRFLAINCAALSETLLESQLFGHVKGAFTGAAQTQKGFLEEAHGGTLFLDEIGDLSPSLQAKLLRVLQEGEFIPVGSTHTKKVNVRFIAATNKNLDEEVRKGRFREDLFFRLNVISLHLPPLRERPEDIEPLARHFLANMIKKVRRELKGISSEAMEAMKSYHWPGNVRELENVIERGAILARGDEITLDVLPLKLNEPPKIEEASLQTTSLSLRDAERIQIIRALKQTGWNKSKAALLLGITRKTLDRKIKDFDLTSEDTE